jgi:hypothetical protein
MIFFTSIYFIPIKPNLALAHCRSFLRILFQIRQHMFDQLFFVAYATVKRNEESKYENENRSILNFESTPPSSS